MTRARLAVAIAVAALAFSTMTLQAGADASGAPDLVKVDTSAYPTVDLTVSVPGGADTITVVEAGRARTASVRAVPAADLEVVLAIDTSGSMKGEPLARARAAAAAFVAALPPEARLAIVGFGPVAEVALPLSTDRALALAAIDGLTARGETALYDALDVAAGQFGADAAAVRTMLVLSDGGDTVSHLSADQAGASVKRTGAALTIVNLVTAESAPAALATLAGAAAGKVVDAADPAALEAVYRDAASAVASQYRVTFDSAHGRATVLELRATRGADAQVSRREITFPSATPTAAVGPRARVDGHRVTPVSWLADSGLWAGAGLILIASLVLLVLAFAVFQPASRGVAGEILPAGGGRGRPPLEEMVNGTTRFAGRLLERRDPGRALNAALDRAGIALRPEEFVVVVALAGVVAGGLLWTLVGGLLVALAGPVVITVGAKLAVSSMATRRQARFDEQLSDTLQLLAGSLRTGYGLLQAIDSVGREAESPTADEFRRVTTETRLGRDVSEALEAMGHRVGGTDLSWVVQAVHIHREVGGNLAEVLDNVSATIRERHRVRRQVSALSAEGRMSATVLMLLPIGFGLVMAVVNPDYFGELVGTSMGINLLLIGTVLMTVGGLWLRRIVRPEF